MAPHLVPMYDWLHEEMLRLPQMEHMGADVFVKYHLWCIIGGQAP